MTREMEWDDRERSRMAALDLYEAGVCECGFHESVTSDPSNLLRPEPRVCPVCAGLTQYHRALNAADEKAREQAKGAPPQAPDPADGRRVFVKFLSPAEAETEKHRRGGEPSSPRATKKSY